MYVTVYICIYVRKKKRYLCNYNKSVVSCGEKSDFKKKTTKTKTGKTTEKTLKKNLLRNGLKIHGRRRLLDKEKHHL